MSLERIDSHHHLPGNADSSAIELALVGGDLSRLSPEQRISYYNSLCTSIGLNPLTKPFEYIVLNGKLVLYAKKDATDQLRKLNQVSITIASREVVEGVYVVVARATLPNGRTDESIGAVPFQGLKGDMAANATMKAETKAKRRVTLSICGLGMLDETEAAIIPMSTLKVPEGLLPTPPLHSDIDERVACAPLLAPVPPRPAVPQPPKSLGDFIINVG